MCHRRVSSRTLGLSYYSPDRRRLLEVAGNARAQCRRRPPERVPTGRPRNPLGRGISSTARAAGLSRSGNHAARGEQRIAPRVTQSPLLLAEEQFPPTLWRPPKPATQHDSIVLPGVGCVTGGPAPKPDL